MTLSRKTFQKNRNYFKNSKNKQSKMIIFEHELHIFLVKRFHKLYLLHKTSYYRFHF